MSGSPTLLPESRLGSTLRRDAWWIEILVVVVVLGGFGVYATLRAFEGNYYFWGPYLSPFARPATITAKRTIARFSSIRPLVPSASLPAAIIAGKPRFLSSSRTSIATFSISRF